MHGRSRPHVVLFFPRAESMYSWYQQGRLEREIALYRRLQQGYDVDVSFVSHGNRYDRSFAKELGNIKLYLNRWNVPRRYYERTLPFLHRRLWKTCDVIRTHQSAGADMVLKIARRWDIPLVARCGYMRSEYLAHQEGRNSLPTLCADRDERSLFAAATQIVVTTVAMAESVRRRVPEAVDRIRVVPNYVDTDVFSPGTVAQRQTDLVYIGRLASEKNVNALLEAVRSLHVTLRVVGGQDEQSRWRKRWGDLGGRIRWMGTISNPRLPQVLRSTKIYILPSHFEGHPKTLIEAMACGMPVIGGNSPGIRELIQHGRTGWLCGTDVSSIRQAIQFVLGNRELQRTLSFNARKCVLEKYSLNQLYHHEWAALQAAMRRRTAIAA